MRRTALELLMLAAVVGGCATGRVNPDEKSAAGHREEAAREREAAHAHAVNYDPKVVVPSPLPPVGAGVPGDPGFSPSVYNPTEVHLQHADEHRAHARQHEKAAQALEQFEEAECRGFPPSIRAACPLLRPVTRIDDVEGGVRVTFAAGTQVGAVAAHMRCHYAYARARAFADNTTCPLYVRGVEFRQVPDAPAIDITAADRTLVRGLRARSREEAVYAAGGPR